MKKKFVILFSFVFLLVITASQAAAMDIVVDENGVISFYQDSVLGQTTNTLERGNNWKAGITENRGGNEKADTTENRGNTPNTERGVTIRERQDAEPIKRVESRENKELLIRSTDRGVDIELQDKIQVNPTLETNTRDEEARYRTSEKIESDRLQVEFSAAPQELSEAERAIHREEYRTQLEAILQERHDRREEMIAIVKETRLGATERLALISRNVSARLQEGAEFVLDPETNRVRVNTPSGNSHEITHLPDQAVERMRAAGVLWENHDFDSLPIEIVERADGTVTYKTQSKESRRLFGLFNRDVDTIVMLDDETGEVTSRVKPNTSVIGQFLDLMSL